MKPKLGSGSRIQRDISNTEFEGIIGESDALKRVLDQARVVARSDATVLILGETGTGKELVARAIHRMSLRNGASFIKLNCAALPLGLLESELFGYEKGAFTDASSPKMGRLELADKGTLFLDEVGELPLQVQPKLLRVLQDGEFERLGDACTIRVNVRLIAASNRNLGREAAEHRFRSDLFYRLNVFPIQLPPLRARPSDIPLLARHFIEKFAARMNKHIPTIPQTLLEEMTNYLWPGNIRELENFIERSVILTEGSVLEGSVDEMHLQFQHENMADDTLRSGQFQHIIKVLKQTRGVISGPNGAARLLGIKRTTLQSIMQRLGISRKDYLG